MFTIVNSSVIHLNVYIQTSSQATFSVLFSKSFKMQMIWKRHGIVETNKTFQVIAHEQAQTSIEPKWLWLQSIAAISALSELLDHVLS